MSTTIKRLTLVVPVVLVLWVALMAVVMRVSDVAPGAVVLFPQTSFMEVLPKSAAILGMNQMALTLANRPGLTGELYDAGAWLVLPAGLTGCLPLTKAQKAALLRG
ncbi:hypothetical protein N9L47_09180 [Rhodobacteraceae bacterium]|nr:hypothetical protein [Paracoccaceae bacterium]